MEQYYLFLVVVLAVIAISDLIVGVSNDAVNFLNSAIGSKAAKMKTILIIAAVGVFVGATFSDGMMEIARKGIFVPTQFTFEEIMIIFLAVMLTDVLLLDVFNTLGMPTSTTVSVVFELFGAAVVMTLIKLTNSDLGLSHIGEYINSEKALAIIMGIFFSVFFAFIIGGIVQYISRIIFSFNYKKNMKVAGPIWVGLGTTILVYFLLVKGLKGSSFSDTQMAATMKENTVGVFLVCFVIATILMFVLQKMKVNILKVLVFIGTFGLAMAFAGNDLVNFIGVPVAGFESYNAWNGSGIAPNEFMMGDLAKPVKTDFWILVFAGSVMIATLAFSKKAKEVIKTSVNLARQDSGSERFKPNAFARFILNIFRALGKVYDAILPARIKAHIEKQYTPLEEKPGSSVDKPAFDLVRASVNLIVASLLIAYGTSHKLPLSTTYVSFMVAMGSSLSDRAWGRESAIYRVSGVLNVIGGWFMTAIIAFTVAGTFALIMYQTGHVGTVSLIIVVVLILISVYFMGKRRMKAQNEEANRVEVLEAIEETKQHGITSTKALLGDLSELYNETIDGLTAENLQKFKSIKASTKELRQENDNSLGEFIQDVKRVEHVNSKAAFLFIHYINHSQDIIHEMRFIRKMSREHVENSLKPLTQEQVALLHEIKSDVASYLTTVQAKFNQLDADDTYIDLRDQKRALQAKLNDALKTELIGINEQRYSSRNGQLMINIINSTISITAITTRFIKLFRNLDKA